MYLSYYKLKTPPFQITSDPRFLWLGETHQEALSTLKYGIYENKSFLMLTGDVGCGKTTLINAFVSRLKKNVICGVLCDPGLSLMDLFNHIAYLFGMEHTFRSKGEFLIGFSRFLNNAHDAGKRILLIIDESQRIKTDLLEEICMLSNIERQNTKLINIFFVGQNEFREMVGLHSNQSLRQKLTFSCQITSLDEKNLAMYIRHRLKIAGTTDPIFNDEACSIIYRYSGGNPRVTNIICDLALLTGFVQEAHIIDGDMILECVQELQLSPVVTEEHGWTSPVPMKEQNKTENWEDDIKYPPEIHGAMRHGEQTEKKFSYHGGGAVSDVYQETKYKEDAIAHDKSPFVKKAPGKEHWTNRLRNDSQLLILLGLVVIVIVLSFYIFYRV
mgnify:CR=1 FL=1